MELNELEQYFTVDEADQLIRDYTQDRILTVYTQEEEYHEGMSMIEAEVNVIGYNDTNTDLTELLR